MLCFFCTTVHGFYGKWPLDLQIGQATRVRSFPHVDGNYALHIYIPSKIIMIFRRICLCKQTVLCFPCDGFAVAVIFMNLLRIDLSMYIRMPHI